MRAREELIERVARRRALRDHLSPQAYQELLEACRKDPQAFVDGDDDEAFALVVKALERLQSERHDEELLDDETYHTERLKHLEQLREACSRALNVDGQCFDARLLALLASDDDPDVQIKPLEQLAREAEQALAGGATPNSGDAWDDVRLRPRLRILAALSRAQFDASRYRAALATCEQVILLDPSDMLGARHTEALCDARLEDEQALDALDVRFGRHGDSWLQLARVIVLYKLGRMNAARRALAGYDRLCKGGSYALLRPVFVDIYLPDRPEAKPYSFEEATLAVHEADPVIMDVPDFAAWAEAQPAIASSAERFADENGFDW